MPWINRDGYDPGKRHYVEGVVREFTSEPLPRAHVENDPLRYQQFVDRATSVTLCHNKRWYGGAHECDEKHFWSEDGYLCTKADSGKLQHKSGGFSVKDKINLMQRNICRECLTQYIAARPAMQAAVDALKQAQVMSE